MAIASNGFGGLQKVLDLREIGVGIAIVHQRVQEFGGFPNRLAPALQAEAFLLLSQHVVLRLVLMVQPIELSHTGVGVGIILAKLVLRLPWPVATFEELIPLFQVFHWSCGLGIAVHATSSWQQRHATPE